MLNKLVVIMMCLSASLLTPSKVDAYGAAHVGYTHVGPNGVQHYGATAVHGPGGTYPGQHGSAYGAGGAYHARSGAAYGGGGGAPDHYSGSSPPGGHFN